ncbi:MAG: sigma-70 family RNA polymerase sigma factor [Thermomicrobiales bacterium]
MERVDHPDAHRGEIMTALEPDHVLASRALHDRAAFAELYQRYLTPIYGYCYRRPGSRESAEDATSLVFTKALESLPGLRTTNVRAWLFAIAHHVVVNSYRRTRNDKVLEEAEELPSPDRTGEIAQFDFELRNLYRALDVLSPEQRQVVELRLAGLTGPEIRQALSRSRSWVDTTQFRAIQKLCTVMAPAPDVRRRELEDGRNSGKFLSLPIVDRRTALGLLAAAVLLLLAGLGAGLIRFDDGNDQPPVIPAVVQPATSASPEDEISSEAEMVWEWTLTNQEHEGR